MDCVLPNAYNGLAATEILNQARKPQTGTNSHSNFKQYLRVCQKTTKDRSSKAYDNFNNFIRRTSLARELRTDRGLATASSRTSDKESAFSQLQSCPGSQHSDLIGFAKALVEGDCLIEAWAGLDLFTKCIQTIQGLPNVNVRPESRSGVDDLHFLQALTAFFTDGQRIYSEGVGSGYSNNGARSITTSDVASLAKQEIFDTMIRLMRIDLSHDRGLNEFTHLFRSIDPFSTTSSIPVVAASTARSQDRIWQEMKLYANLLMITVSCLCLGLVAGSHKVSQSIEGKRVLSSLNINTPASKSHKHRQISDNAIHLLDAFSQIYHERKPGSRKIWTHLHCALFASSLLEIGLPLYDKRDSKRAKHVLARFKSDVDIGGSSGSPLRQFREQGSDGIDHGWQTDLSHACSDDKVQISGKATQSGSAPAHGFRAFPSAHQALVPKAAVSSAWSSLELCSMQSYLDIMAKMMNRSSRAPCMWYNLIPKVAAQHQCVQYALLACADGSKAILHSHASSSLPQRKANADAMVWASQAMRSAIHGSPPPYAFLLMSVLLGCFGLLSGRPEDATMHVRHGLRICHSYTPHSVDEKAIYTFSYAFMGSSMDISAKGHGETPSRQKRLTEAVNSLRSSHTRLKELTQDVYKATIMERQRILVIINHVQCEIEWLMPRWQKKLTAILKTKERKTHRKVTFEDEALLPWDKPMAHLQQYLDNGAAFEMEAFEIAMGRAMPLFALSKADKDLDLREEAVELMMTVGPMIRGKG